MNRVYFIKQSGPDQFKFPGHVSLAIVTFIFWPNELVQCKNTGEYILKDQYRLSNGRI